MKNRNFYIITTIEKRRSDATEGKKVLLSLMGRQNRFVTEWKVHLASSRRSKSNAEEKLSLRIRDIVFYYVGW